MPIISGKAPSPGTLKTGFIIGANSLPRISTASVWDNNSEAIKNGKREGTTEFHHKLKALFEAPKLLLGNTRNSIKNVPNIKGKNSDLSFIVKSFI